MKKNWKWFVFAVILILFVVRTRARFQSPYLFGWDSVQYALSLEHYDVRLHQPHPPGYLLYSFTARILNYFIHDPNVTLIRLNVLATVGAGFIIALLVRELTSESDDSKRFWLAIGAAAIFVSNPITWLYGCVAEIYAVEGFFTALITYLVILSFRQPAFLIWASAAIAIGGGYRLSTEIFLLPLYAAGYLGKDRRIRLYSILVFLIGNAAWLAVVVTLTGGPERYYLAMFRQTTRSIELTSVLVPEAAKRGFAVQVLPYRLLQACTLPVLVALLLRCYKIRINQKELLLLLAPIPPLLFFFLAHFPKDGYLMVVIPILVTICIVLFGKLYHRKIVLIVVLLTACFLNYRIFLKPPFYSNEEAAASRWKWIANALTFPNKHTIIAYKVRLHDFFQSVAKIAPGGRLFILHADYFPDWRTLTYYYPNDPAVLILPKRKRTYLAKHHRYEMQSPPMILDPQNRILIAVSPKAPEVKMDSFQVYEYRYHYIDSKNLAQKFQLYSFPFELR